MFPQEAAYSPSLSFLTWIVGADNEELNTVPST